MAPSKTLHSSFLLLLLHLRCFVLPVDDDGRSERRRSHDIENGRSFKKKCKLPPLLSSSWPFLQGIVFSSTKPCKSSIQTHPSMSPRSSQHSTTNISSLVFPEKPIYQATAAVAVISRKRSPSLTESEIPSVAAASSDRAPLLSFYLLLLLHLGCIVFPADNNRRSEHRRSHNIKNGRSIKKKRKHSPLLSSSWSFLKGIVFSSGKFCKSSVQTHPSTPSRSTTDGAAHWT